VGEAFAALGGTVTGDEGERAGLEYSGERREIGSNGGSQKVELKNKMLILTARHYDGVRNLVCKNQAWIRWIT